MQTLSELLNDSETIVNDATHTHSTWETGDVAHQGDVIFVAIKRLPKSAVPRKDRQLAEGNTQGSRHIADTGNVYDADPAEVAAAIKAATGCDIAADYVGPVFEGPAHISHPEHGDQVFPGHCTVAVVYQRSLDAEQREARVRD